MYQIFWHSSVLDSFGKRRDRGHGTVIQTIQPSISQAQRSNSDRQHNRVLGKILYAQDISTCHTYSNDYPRHLILHNPRDNSIVEHYSLPIFLLFSTISLSYNSVSFEPYPIPRKLESCTFTSNMQSSWRLSSACTWALL